VNKVPFSGGSTRQARGKFRRKRKKSEKENPRQRALRLAFQQNPDFISWDAEGGLTNGYNDKGRGRKKSPPWSPSPRREPLACGLVDGGVTVGRAPLRASAHTGEGNAAVGTRATRRTAARRASSVGSVGAVAAAASASCARRWGQRPPGPGGRKVRRGGAK